MVVVVGRQHRHHRIWKNTPVVDLYCFPPPSKFGRTRRGYVQRTPARPDFFDGLGRVHRLGVGRRDSQGALDSLLLHLSQACVAWTLPLDGDDGDPFFQGT